MSLTAGSSIYTGPWINWSHGLVLGSTITLSERDGGLLTAFLAIFVSAAGVACWRMMSYALHQHRASHEYQDGLHHQQQAIFRNTGSAGAASWELFQLIWYWRKHAVKPILRTLPLVALAFLNLALFSVAGIFSSEVTKAAGNETLIRSPDCGVLIGVPSGLASVQGLTVYNTKDSSDTLAAATYSRACYESNQTSVSCNQYARQSLPWTTNQNASCPFASEVCWYGGTGAYEMDSGLIDSHKALGINARKADRIQYRKVTSCSPLHTTNYAKEFNDTDENSSTYGDTLAQYLYGGVSGGAGSPSNYTYQYNKHGLYEDRGYDLRSFIAYAGPASNAWTPVSALNRTDADVSLFFFAPYSVLYADVVTDPVFAASIPISLPGSNGTNFTWYSSDRYASAVACTDQHQFCNPVTTKCTALTAPGILGTDFSWRDQITLNDAQFATATHIGAYIEELTTYSSVSSRGASALRASETNDNNFQVGLPNTQWMTEVSAWFGVGMAKLQQSIVQYAIGPPSIPDGYVLTRPSDREGKKLCRNQKIRNANGTISFSVLGVAIILIVGAILIALQLVLEPVMGFIRQHLHWKDHKRLQWAMDEKLQLQRLAYEEAGQGRWSGGASSVPVTRKGDTIGMPIDMQTDHPRLGRAGIQSVAEHGGMPEREGLMEPKQMNYSADAM